MHSSRWVLRSLLLGALTLLARRLRKLGCDHDAIRWRTHYPPSDPASVQILRTKPTKSHDRLSEIVMDAAIHPVTLGNDVERKLRQEAAKMGADVVVVVYDHRQPMGAYVMGGYWNQSIETVTGRNVVGVAIKYRP